LFSAFQVKQLINQTNQKPINQANWSEESMTSVNNATEIYTVELKANDTLKKEKKNKIFAVREHSNHIFLTLELNSMPQLGWSSRPPQHWFVALPTEL